MSVNLGILAASLINVGTSNLHYGWRISLGAFIPPAILLLLGAIFLPETPNSLVERGRTEEAQRILKKLRGPETDISDEYSFIVADAKEANKDNIDQSFLSQWRIFFSHPYRGEATVSCMVAFFSQFTGINSMLYYTPELFQSLGSGTNQALVNATVVNAVLLAGAITSMSIVDRVGRRPLLIVGGALMAVFQICVGILLALKYDPTDGAVLAENNGRGILALICLFTYTFGVTWGPLGWLVPVECQSQKTRSTGATASVSVNFFAVFITTQSFLVMLCSMQWGAFLFFALFDILMTVFAWMLIPETKGVPIENMRDVWKMHWFWGTRFVQCEEGDGLVKEELDEQAGG
jgi:sugar porter (SP) family MFS transporter